MKDTTKNKCTKCNLIFPEAWGLEKHTCGKVAKEENWEKEMVERIIDLIAMQERNPFKISIRAVAQKIIEDFIRKEKLKSYEAGFEAASKQTRRIQKIYLEESRKWAEGRKRK